MTSGQRIRELCAQLLRAEHSVVIEAVATELHDAIDVYVGSAGKQPAAIIELPPPSDEKAA